MPALPPDHPIRPPSSNPPSSSSPTSDPPASLSEWGSNNPFLQSSYANGTTTSRYSTADSCYYGSYSSRAGGSSSFSDLDRKQYGARPNNNDDTLPAVPYASTSSAVVPPAYDSYPAAPPDYGEVVPVDEFGELPSQLDLPTTVDPSSARASQQRPPPAQRDPVRIDAIVAAALTPGSGPPAFPHLQPLLDRDAGNDIVHQLTRPTGPPRWSLHLERVFRMRSRQEWEELCGALSVIGRKIWALEAELAWTGRWTRQKLVSRISAMEVVKRRLLTECGFILYYARRVYWVHERKHGVEPYRIIPRLEPFKNGDDSTQAERDAHEQKRNIQAPHQPPSIGPFDAGPPYIPAFEGQADMCQLEEEAFWQYAA